MSKKIQLTAQAKADMQTTAWNIADAERAIVDCLYRYIDRMNDHCESDTAAQILDEFTSAVRPLIEQHDRYLNDDTYG